MAIIRIIKRECPFVQVDKRPLNDPRLSFKATGILVYLLGKPCDWEVRMEELAGAKTDGIDAVRSGMQELRQHGYAKLVVDRDPATGRAMGTRWEIYELPGQDAPDVRKKPTSAKPRDGEKADIGKTPTSGKPDPTKNNPSETNKDVPYGAMTPAELFKLEAPAHPELPAELSCNPDLVALWEEWKAYRKSKGKGKALGPFAIKRQVGDMKAWGVQRSIAALNHSLKMQYEGLYEPKGAGKGANGSPAAPRGPITKATALKMPTKA